MRYTGSMPIIWRFIKWRFGISRSEAAQGAYVPAYAAPDLAAIKSPDAGKVQLTWVGHSTFLIQAAGLNILTDPIWSERASPVSWAGPKRLSRPGVDFADLPPIDIVLVSHTHYDHLDRPTILKLGNKPRYIVPENVAPWFNAEKISNAEEVRWWQSTKIGGATIHAVPAKHWSRRRLFAEEHMGWGGYIVETSAGIVYFAGDTGYHPEYFKEIGKRFPRIDLALIPIGAYYPQEIFGTYHIDPHDAVRIHQEVGAKRSIGMHWGAFRLTQEPMSEPPRLLAREVEAAGLGADEFTTLKIGETRPCPAG